MSVSVFLRNLVTVCAICAVVIGVWAIPLLMRLLGMGTNVHIAF